jgi:hypothetical protein
LLHRNRRSAAMRLLSEANPTFGVQADEIIAKARGGPRLPRAFNQPRGKKQMARMKAADRETDPDELPIFELAEVELAADPAKPLTMEQAQQVSIGYQAMAEILASGKA